MDYLYVYALKVPRRSPEVPEPGSEEREDRSDVTKGQSTYDALADNVTISRGVCEVTRVCYVVACLGDIRPRLLWGNRGLYVFLHKAQE